MKLSTHVILQIFGLLIQVLNLSSGMTHGAAQLWIALVITFFQGVVAIINHNFNPDGTPATVAYMPKVAAVFLFVCLIPCLLHAQTATPLPSPSPIFSVSTQAVAIRIGGQTVAGTDAIGSFNVTPNLQLQTDNMLAPGNNFQDYLFGIKYYAPVLAKPLAKTTLSNISPYLHIAAGICRNVPATGPSQQHNSFMSGSGFDYKVNGTFSVGPRIEYLNAPGFGGSPHGLTISASLTFVLGSH